MKSVLELAEYLARSPSILIVEDDPSAGHLLSKVLWRYDCEVVYADSVEQGLAEIGRSKFDLAFVDLLFPKGSGVDVIRKLKALRPETPIAVMTGYWNHPLVHQALELGVFTVLRKPCDCTPSRIQELLGTLKIKARLRPENWPPLSAPLQVHSASPA